MKRWFNRNRVLSNSRIIVALILVSSAAAIAFMAMSSHAVAQPTAAPANQQLSPEEARLREEWRISMAQVPLPKKGCFEASYPSKEWREVPCTTGPDYPMPPRRGPRPLVVGNGDDVAAQAPSGFIATAIGSFDSVSGVTSESGPIGNTGPAVANAYTLQLNTNFFPSSVSCTGSPNPGCQGWQQFVFENNNVSHRAFIQYWLIKYNTTCPAGQGWNQFSFTGSTDIYCWKNNTGGVVNVPSQPITNLGNLSLTGAVSSTADSVTLFDGTTAYARAGDNAVNAANGWSIAEFNIFGDGGNSAGGGQASFNSGSTIVPRTRIIYGGTAAPNCVAQGFTAETNNLSFGPGAPATSPPGPAIFFTESSAGGATSACAAATSVGDTHLATINGLFYDFQASGDFILAQVDPDFVVQARQASGAPQWPNASVNKAVAARMGKNQVAVCLGSPPAPESQVSGPLFVDGKPTPLADGGSLAVGESGSVLRQGNAYFIIDANGNSVRAELNSSWINVSVGFGRSPANVHGLLANAGGNVNQIATRDGTVLTNPFSFEDLYHPYADSWRVAASESLLSVCGDRNVERGSPRRPFYANDLEPGVYERTRAVCTAAGVKAGPLLDACTLDVAVIGDDKAAQVFVNAPEPVAVGKPVVSKTPGLIKWLVLLILIVIVLLLLLFLKKRKTP
jgi:hypothetical protein